MTDETGATDDAKSGAAEPGVPEQTPVPIRLREAPWAELESDHLVLTLPSAVVRQLDRPDLVMDHWDAVLPGKVLHVQYEEVVDDLETQVRRILKYCDLPWNDACLRFYETDRAVKTASSEQVRQPIYASSKHLWRNYERHLEPMVEVLEPLLAELPEDWQPDSIKH